ncbi:MAG: glycosyltransferase family 1 protein [bacterium]
MIIGIDASRANRSYKSGTEWYSYYLIRELARLDDKNQYILYTDEPLKAGLSDLTSASQHKYDQRGHVSFDKDGFQIINSPHNNFKAKVLKWPFKFFWTLGGMSLEMIFNQPDVLFVPAHGLPLICPKKTIATIHDIGFKHKDKLYSKEDVVYKSRLVHFLVSLFTLGKYVGTKSDYLDWSTNFALKHAQKIITISDFSKTELLKHYSVSEEKVKVIYNGFNQDIYKPIDDQDKIKAVLEKYVITQPYIFYIGRLEKKKNTPALIEAYALARQQGLEEKLCLVGEASYGYDEIKYMISEFGVQDHVIIVGWANEEDVPYIFAGARAFVFPSLYEGFGIPLLQAMACNIPICASDITSIPEIANGSALLFNPNNVYDMAEKLVCITSDEDKRAELILRGQERVKEFSWEKAATELLQEINNL